MSMGRFCSKLYRDDSITLIVNGVECKVTLEKIIGRQAQLVIEAPRESVRIVRDSLSKKHFKSGEQ